MVDDGRRASKAGAAYSGTYRSTRLGRLFTTLAILPLGLLFIAGGIWCGLGPKGTLENRSIFLTVCPALGLCFVALWWHVQMYRLEILADRFRLRGIRGTREHLNTAIGGYRLFEVGSLT